MIRPEPTTIEEMRERALAARAALGLTTPMRPVIIAPRAPAVQAIVETSHQTVVKPARPTIAERVEAIRRHADQICERSAQDGFHWKLPDLLIVAAAAAKLPLEALKSKRRDEEVVRPRQIFFWLSRRFTKRSLSEMARLLCRDHTTALHAIRRVEDAVPALGPADVDDPFSWTEHLLSRPWPSFARAKR